jgi:hypothetical protein
MERELKEQSVTGRDNKNLQEFPLSRKALPESILHLKEVRQRSNHTGINCVLMATKGNTSLPYKNTARYIPKTNH